MGCSPWGYMTEHAGRWVGSNKLVELKKKKKNTGVGCHFLLQRMDGRYQTVRDLVGCIFEVI